MRARMWFSIWFASSLFLWSAELLLFSAAFIELPGKPIWFLLLAILASVVGVQFCCPVCGALTTARWIDGDGRGVHAAYLWNPFVTPHRCARCDLDFDRNWFSGEEIDQRKEEWKQSGGR
jgi:hypothetical protein